MAKDVTDEKTGAAGAVYVWNMKLTFTLNRTF